MNGDLFVYGTLMVPEIQMALLGRKPDFENTVLSGFNTRVLVYSDAETDYPVLAREEGRKVNGLLLKDLTKSELDLLSFYEGDEYLIKEIQVFVGDKQVKAYAYLPKSNNASSLGEIWSLKAFKENSLADYLNDVIPVTLSEYKSQA